MRYFQEIPRDRKMHRAISCEPVQMKVGRKGGMLVALTNHTKNYKAQDVDQPRPEEIIEFTRFFSRV